MKKILSILFVALLVGALVYGSVEFVDYFIMGYQGAQLVNGVSDAVSQIWATEMADTCWYGAGAPYGLNWLQMQGYLWGQYYGMVSEGFYAEIAGQSIVPSVFNIQHVDAYCPMQ